ncbi:coiled-coil domain-containing protein 81-like isoform X3 [Gadus macrocephalus]|uniref:coiled-coil domain-containing protein 81-like isoform X3 n=1 Tax=Gadus macrocephalus TaxID=80720 RepID=UPI0028CB7418|nr:coiled-coil domain-containing protein 81-like isoform X3 [Gadus macrocephalus]
MTDLLHLASDTERNLLPTLSGLSRNDIDSIWGYVAEYIEHQMTSQKGVHVAGLGTFSFSQLQLDLGNKMAVIQRPIFLLAEKLVQTQNLRHKRPLATAFLESLVHPAGGHEVQQGLCEDPGLYRKTPAGPVQRPRDPRPSRPDPAERSGVHGVPLSGGPKNSDYPPQAAKKSSVSFSPPEGVVTEEAPHRETRCTGHTRAGQELCYLCMQRSQRNVPLYLREARRAEEVEQEVLLLLKGQQEEELYLQGEQAHLGQQRAFSEQVAAFNLGASKTLKEQRAQKPQFHGSYLFAERPLTAALQGARERGHLEGLRDQLLSQRSRGRRAQQERLLLERVDQAQLAQEVALQRKQQFLQKQQRVDHYRRALDLQVEHGRGPQCTQDRQPISTGVGRWESEATANENRERAQKVSQEQLMAATQKRKEDASRRRTQQQTEKEMLSLNRKELILDHLRCFEASKDMRASLEDTWRDSARLKLRREEEEKSFRRSGGALLLDQGDQHRRCHQCKRKPGNQGQSNIWRESCYTSGSRIMM